MVDKYEERQAKAEEAKARKARKAAAEAEAEAEEAKTKPKKKKKKVLPKNQARIAKNECERKRYCLMSEKDHEKIKARSLACQEKHRQALRENLEASEKHRKKDRERKKKISPVRGHCSDSQRLLSQSKGQDVSDTTRKDWSACRRQGRVRGVYARKSDQSQLQHVVLFS